MSFRFVSQIRIAMNFLTAVLLFPLVLILAAFKKVIHEERTWKGALSQSFKDWMGSRMQDLLFVLATSIIVSIPICLLLKYLGVSENALSILGWIIVILVVLVIYLKKRNQDLGVEYDEFFSWPIGKQLFFTILRILLCIAAFFLINSL
jgi:hypothetical protein